MLIKCNKKFLKKNHKNVFAIRNPTNPDKINHMIRNNF